MWQNDWYLNWASLIVGVIGVLVGVLTVKVHQKIVQKSSTGPALNIVAYDTASVQIQIGDKQYTSDVTGSLREVRKDED